jgi:hypothetical protein
MLLIAWLIDGQCIALILPLIFILIDIHFGIIGHLIIIGEVGITHIGEDGIEFLTIDHIITNLEFIIIIEGIEI